MDLSKVNSIDIHFRGPKLTPVLAEQLRSVAFAADYEGSPLSEIMDGPNGDFSYDRFQVRDGNLWAASDGLSPEYAGKIVAHFQSVAEQNPDSQIMLVAEFEQTEEQEEADEDPTQEVIFNSGFTLDDDPSGFLK